MLEKVIAAEGEHKASRALRHAADVITGNPAALQLRYLQVFKCSSAQVLKCSHSVFQQLFFLQTLNNISAENNSTIVFPVPVDIMATFMQNMSLSRAPTPAQVSTKFKFVCSIIFQNLTNEICFQAPPHLPVSPPGGGMPR